MKADGTILIDTKIVDGGMEKGFELIKDEMSSVGITAKQVGEQIQLSFSKMDVSKPIANAVAKVQQLEQQLAAITSEYQLSVSEGDDKSAERLAAKRIAIYDRLEAAREKLSAKLSDAVQREADAEEKASQQAIKAAEKEAAAKQRATEKQFRDMTKPARRFGTRFREIVSGALVFNLLSSGLRELTNYFGTALKSNAEFSASFAQLKGAFFTAFQPIYEFVLPALNALMRALTVIMQAVGSFFAAITGKSYSQMQKNAKALNQQAEAISGVGGAAEKAAKQLAGFDEINRLESNSSGGGGGGGAFGSGEIAPDFNTAGLTPELEKILALVGAIGTGLLAWKIASMFTDSLSQAAGLGIAVGGAMVYAYSWADAFANGIDWDNLSGMLLGATAIVGGLALAFGTTGAAIGLLITGFTMVVLALREWIETGELSTEACTTLVIGLMAIGAAISLLTGSWLPLLIAGFAAAAAIVVANWEDIRNYFETTFADGFWNGITRMFNDIGNWLLGWLGDLINWMVRELNGLLSFFGRFSLVGGETVANPVNYSTSPAIAAYSETPEIPHLAKGAVLPANKPFLAMVGDQKNGTNVEAPLDTIKQALAEVMAEYGGGDIQINFTGDLAQLARILYPEIHKQDRNTARARGW